MKRFSNLNKTYIPHNIQEELRINKDNKKIPVIKPDNFFELADIIEERVELAEQNGSDTLNLDDINTSEIIRFYREKNNKGENVFSILNNNRNITTINVSLWDFKSARNTERMFKDLKYIKRIIGINT